MTNERIRSPRLHGAIPRSSPHSLATIEHLEPCLLIYYTYQSVMPMIRVDSANVIARTAVRNPSYNATAVEFLFKKLVNGFIHIISSA
jgi:hypothetical protein